MRYLLIFDDFHTAVDAREFVGGMVHVIADPQVFELVSGFGFLEGFGVEEDLAVVELVVLQDV
jgi:hypothetical protein